MGAHGDHHHHLESSPSASRIAPSQGPHALRSLTTPQNWDRLTTRAPRNASAPRPWSELRHPRRAWRASRPPSCPGGRWADPTLRRLLEKAVQLGLLRLRQSGELLAPPYMAFLKLASTLEVSTAAVLAALDVLALEWKDHRYCCCCCCCCYCWHCRYAQVLSLPPLQIP